MGASCSSCRTREMSRTSTASPAGAEVRHDTSRACTGRVAELVRPETYSARYVVAHAEQGFTSNLPLAALERRRRDVRHDADGEPLHARPRLAAPAGRAGPLLLEEREVAARDRADRARPPGSGSATATTTTPIRGRNSATRSSLSYSTDHRVALVDPPAEPAPDRRSGAGDIGCGIVRRRPVTRQQESRTERKASRSRLSRCSPLEPFCVTTVTRASGEHRVSGHDQGPRAVIQADRAGGVTGHVEDVEREPPMRNRALRRTARRQALSRR